MISKICEFETSVRTLQLPYTNPSSLSKRLIMCPSGALIAATCRYRRREEVGKKQVRKIFDLSFLLDVLLHIRYLSEGWIPDRSVQVCSHCYQSRDCALKVLDVERKHGRITSRTKGLPFHLLQSNHVSRTTRELGIFWTLGCQLQT